MKLWAKIGTHPAGIVITTNKRKVRIGLKLSVRAFDGAAPIPVRITNFRYIDGRWLYFMEQF